LSLPPQYRPNPLQEAANLLTMVHHGTLTVAGARALISISEGEVVTLRKILDRRHVAAAIGLRAAIRIEFDRLVSATPRKR